MAFPQPNLDGCHGYPYPALDWHYFDKRMKVGGVIGMDNAELRPVREPCEFLVVNGTYREVGFVAESCFARSYETQRDEGGAGGFGGGEGSGHHEMP